MTTTYLILGSNSTDKKEKLERAVVLLSQRAGIITQSSSIYKTAAWGYHSPNNYLNQVVLLTTSFSAQELLHITQEIEKHLGREEKSINGQYKDRPIDIDILFYEKSIIKEANLEIPHPRMSERRFVLEPLSEIAPMMVHPVSKKTVIELLNDCKDELAVERL